MSVSQATQLDRRRKARSATGCVRRLQWKHVDFTRRKIAICEGRIRKDERLPKTQESNRDIEMLEPVYDLLLRHRGETWLCGNYVFLNQEGKPMDINTLRRRIWYPALKRAGIRARTLCQTQHTLATLILAAGENPDWIAAQLGSHQHPNALSALYEIYSERHPPGRHGIPRCLPALVWQYK